MLSQQNLFPAVGEELTQEGLSKFLGQVKEGTKLSIVFSPQANPNSCRASLVFLMMAAEMVVPDADAILNLYDPVLLIPHPHSFTPQFPRMKPVLVTANSKFHAKDAAFALVSLITQVELLY